MLDKLQKIMDVACKWGNENFGTSIQFPKPTKKSMVSSAFSSGIISSVITIYGLFLKNIWILLFGGLGILSSVFIYRKGVKND
ncbi:hypothetical protein FJQ98_11185 [Lysinibacillus agricola]|uniref:Uncharacterized protein n=1 Tax=Lysinibacillus agricola TaxID=2590012 RepID=A0ABX7AX17_9BACI|nr:MULTISPECIES: hypothetical protein [Lysinibacillus]KOS60228.1 hypothetical protein AN161_24320 [Lysinibacillus sp. FJAT-14222]QQP14517.1 hypothetical protein FJQ98_11185 [Lysinibacillus agricola]